MREKRSPSSARFPRAFLRVGDEFIMRQLNRVSGCLILLSCLFCAALHAESYTFTTFAGPDGGGLGANDGPGATAQFDNPTGMAVDGSGNIYVADTYNNTIRKITPGGAVSTLAGLAGSTGCADGTGSTARFDRPGGVAVDSSGNVFVADTYNNTIRKITPAGVVTTIAGSASSSPAHNDGTGAAARFFIPHGIAVDSTGVLYVADSYNQTIRKITAGGVVTTLAGTAGTFGDTDGAGSVALFNYPFGIAVDGSGNLYVADTNSSTIRMVTPAGVVSTLAGTALDSGNTNATGAAARFYLPYAVTVDASGNVYVADTDNDTIRKITPGAVVTRLSGSAQNTGSTDGVSTVALFNFPQGIAVDASGNLYVGDTVNNAIRKVTPDGTASTLAGSVGAEAGGTDGAGTAARFNFPAGVAVDSSGTVYVADAQNDTIRKITSGGLVSTLAGTAGNGGSTDAIGAAASFSNPFSVAVDTGGNVYVADKFNYTIRKITPLGSVSTLAGMAGVGGGHTDGTGSAARFYDPDGVAVDSSGNVYVGDQVNYTIRKITPGGAVTTLAGTAGSSGSADGTGAAARFTYPEGVAVDSSGNVYVADRNNSTIRKITPAGVVTTLAGTAGSGGTADGTGAAAQFSSPYSVAVDAGGNVFVADSGNNLIRKITPAGVVTTLAGSGAGNTDGSGAAAQFNDPNGIAVDSSGNLYVADSNNNSIRIGRPTLADIATIDSTTVTVGVQRQLDTAPQTATSWSWSLIRQPGGSSAQLSSTTIRNPTFTPDVDDLYIFRLVASNSTGTSVSTISLGGAPATNPVPTITGFLPVAAAAGGSDFTLTISGTNFVAGSVVKWAGQANLTPTSQSADIITVLVPASYIAKKGSASISVVNPTPGGGTSNVLPLPISTPATTITSGPTATPNPAVVQTAVVFNVAAANSNHASLTYAWDFGDGSQATGASPNHTYASAGVYDAVVTIDDGVAPVTGSVEVTVTAAVIGEGPDSDGDGFSDSFETFAGTNPNSAASTPTGQPLTAGNIAGLVVTKAQIKLNFAKPGGDSISFSGTLNIPQGFNPNGAVVLIDAGGVLKKLTLGSKGSVKAGNDSFKLTLKSTKGVVQASPAAKFSAAFSKGTFAETLGTVSQLSNGTFKNALRPVAFSVVFNGTALKKGQLMHYTATLGKSGSAK